MFCPSAGRENLSKAQFCDSCGARLDDMDDESLFSRQDSVACGSRMTFVGRLREMAALEDALSGHGRLVMLVGEPGMGKTRTARVLGTV